MGSIHYRNGSEFPPIKNKNIWRVYGMRFCPFVQRTLLVLEHKQIDYEVININLKDKPSWFLERTPVGLVPLMEKGDHRVFDSTVCNYFLNETYPQYRLLPSDPYDKAKVRMLMEQFGKVSAHHGALRLGHKDAEKCAEVYPQFLQGLQTFESNLDGKFFGGKSLGMLDIHMWPFFERIPVLNTLLNRTIITEFSFPKLWVWMKDMYETPAVKALMHDTDTHLYYIMSSLAGSPDYDLERK